MKKSDFEYFEGDKYDLPCFGFKIHISSTIDNYEYIFSLVKPYLCKYGIIFKYLKSKEIIKQNFSETESPTESGKFITIYPKNT
ncbi:class III lanthionine synthetase LanKC N-terminal domain-containing protein, partial [Streptococcus intermedius]